MHSKRVVSRRQPKFKRPSFKNEQIQKNWNYSKTISENYNDLGLKTSLNNAIGTRAFNKQMQEWSSKNRKEDLDADILTSQEQIYNELNHIFQKTEPESEGKSIVDEFKQQNNNMENTQKMKKPLPLFAVNLTRKYGTDYKAMAMDVQINRLQLSEGKLKKIFNHSN